MYKKLLTCQKTIKPILKEESNPHFRSKYFDINSLLAAVKPVLNEQGLFLSQPLVNLNGKPFLMTTIVEVETGEKLCDSVPLPELADPQKFGSAVSYFRRFSLVSMLAIEGEDDDDANTASKPIHASNGPETVKVHTLGADGDEPSYSPVEAVSSAPSGSCEKCGGWVKSPYKICWKCRTKK